MNMHCLRSTIPLSRAPNGRLLRARALQGFSLTEMAIVLGVIGVILGTIWVAGASVTENQRTKHAAEQAMFTLESFRSLYAGRRIDTAGINDVTTFAINNGLVPTDMIHTGDTTTLYPPYSGSALKLLSNGTYNALSLSYTGLTQSACVHLSTALGTQVDSLEAATINSTTRNSAVPGVTVDAQFTPVEIDTNCGANNNNSIAFLYGLGNETH